MSVTTQIPVTPNAVLTHDLVALLQAEDTVPLRLIARDKIAGNFCDIVHNDYELSRDDAAKIQKVGFQIYFSTLLRSLGLPSHMRTAAVTVGHEVSPLHASGVPMRRTGDRWVLDSDELRYCGLDTFAQAIAPVSVLEDEDEDSEDEDLYVLEDEDSEDLIY